MEIFNWYNSSPEQKELVIYEYIQNLSPAEKITLLLSLGNLIKTKDIDETFPIKEKTFKTIHAEDNFCVIGKETVSEVFKQVD